MSMKITYQKFRWQALLLCVMAAGCGGGLSDANLTTHERGVRAFNQGRLGAAIRAFETHAAENPKAPDADRWLARALARGGKYTRAIEAWDRALALKSDDGEGWQMLGELSFGLGRYRSAYRALSKARRHGRTGALVDARLAECEIQLRRPKTALARTIKALAKYPESADLHLTHGRALVALYQPHKAVKAYRRAAKLAPTDPRPHIAVGQIYEATHFPRRAVTAYKRAIKIQPQHVVGLLNLGRVLVQVGEAVSAIPYLARAKRIQPDNAAIHHTQGAAFAASAMAQEAVIAFTAALKLDNTQPATHSAMAEAYYLLGRLKDAERHLRKALSLDGKRLADRNVLRRVALLQVVVEVYCEFGGSLGSSALARRIEPRLISRWDNEGWPRNSHRADMASMMNDKQALSVARLAAKRCQKKKAAPTNSAQH
jgi:tetratricopeptide (TPR) repeat protein